MVYRAFGLLFGATTLVACGTMPLPMTDATSDVSIVVKQPSMAETESTSEAAQAQLPIEPQSEANSAESGAIHGDTSKAAKKNRHEADTTLSAEDSISIPRYEHARDYSREALRALAEGEAAYAHALLKRSLELEPQHSLSLRLLKQIEVDPTEGLGDVFFEHVLREGESLSRLAELYLHDPLMFYWLARYNGLEKPGDIKIGQIVRIPGKGKQEMAEPPVAKADDTRYAEAAKAFQGADYEKVIQIADGSSVEIGETDPTNQNYRKLLAKSYYQLGLRAEKENKLEKALEYFNRAVEQDAANKEYIGYMERAKTKMQIENTYANATLLLSENKVDEAAQAFQKVGELQPGHPGALQGMKQIQRHRLDQLYRQALAAQKRQELDKAIALWDQYLTSDAKNESAKQHRQRAVELRQNLQTLVEQ